MTTREDFEKLWHPICPTFDSITSSHVYKFYEACAAHYEAERNALLALIAEKDKALKSAKNAIKGREHTGFIDEALSLTHDSVILKEAARVGKLVNSVCLDSTNAEKRWDYLPIGTKLYTIVKGV